MAPKRRAREDPVDEEDEEEEDDEVLIEGTVSDRFLPRAVRQVFAERAIMRSPDGTLKVINPTFLALINNPLCISNSPVSCLAPRALVLAFDPLFQAPIRALQRFVAAGVPAMVIEFNPLIELALSELATLHFFLNASLKGSTRTSRNLGEVYTQFATDASSLAATPSNMILQLETRSVVSLLLKSQHLQTLEDFKGTTATPQAPLPTYNNPTPTHNNPPVPSQNQVPPFRPHVARREQPRQPQNPEIFCSGCGGHGHVAAACASPHPRAQPHWVCGVCRGKGHPTASCPSK